MSGRWAAPTSLEELLTFLADGYRPVAGGTDLVVGERQGKAPLPGDLVSLHRLEPLRGIADVPAGGLRIGALTSHQEIAEHPGIAARWTALADGAAIVGSPATRATGTVGGNIANASPAADTVAPLICLGATVILRSAASGERIVALDGLATGPGRTIVLPDELLVAVELPPPEPGTGSCYVRLEFRRQMEIAVVGAAAVLALSGGLVMTARIAITALAPTIRRVPEAEAALLGTDGTGEAVRVAGRAVSEASRPISDVRAPEDYRRAMAAVVTRRAIAAALARARGETVLVPASDTLFGAVA